MKTIKRPLFYLQLTTALKGFLLILLLSINTLSSASRRPNINTFTTCEQYDLVTLMMNYLTPAIVNDHALAMATAHNYDDEFCIWHRAYIKDMEDWLATQSGGAKFVPLPKWDPATSIPNAFFNSSTIPFSCTNAGNASNSLLTPVSTYPNLIRQNPNILGWYDFSGFFNSATLCSYTSGTCASRPTFGTAYDNLACDLEDEHDLVHGAIGGAMGSTVVASGAAIFWLWHAFVDDVCHDWECDCASPSPFPATDIYIADSSEDIGNEPNNETGSIWRSPSIYVRNSNDGLTDAVRYDPLRHQNPEYTTNPAGRSYVNVDIKNIGCQSVSGATVFVYYANASVGLTWPGDFTLIGSEPVNTLQPGESIVEVVDWDVPSPTAAGDHYCLAARIVSGVDPMFNEGNPERIEVNARNNNNIAQKNVTVVDLVHGFTISSNTLTILSGLDGGEFTIRFNESGDDNPFNPTIYFSDVLFNIWAEGGFQGEGAFENLGNNNIEVYRDSEISGLIFPPNERYPIQLDFDLPIGAPITEDKVFTWNVELYKKENGEQILVDGEEYELRIDVPCDDINKLPDDIIIKAGECIELITDVECEDCNISWSPAVGLSNPSDPNPTVCPETTTTYSVTVFDVYSGCNSTKSITVHVDYICQADAGGDKVIDLGDCITLGPLSPIEGAEYQWSNGATNPYIEVCPEETTNYLLTTFVPQSNCFEETEITVFTKTCPKLDVPQNYTIDMGDCIEIGLDIPPMQMETIRWFSNPPGDYTIDPIIEVCPTETTQYTVLHYRRMTGCIQEINILVNVNRCIETLTIDSGIIESGIYQAGTLISATGDVAPANTVQFKAGERIKLENGFSVKENSVFSAYIEDCN